MQALADAVPAGSRVADIGSDHGRLPRLLIRGGRALRCVATEYGSGPSRRLRETVAACPEADRIEVRRGCGLDPLSPDDRLDVLVLSGMGGATMLSILDPQRLETLGVKLLVLQPQSGWAELRAGLETLGWSVGAERLVRDRERFYTVMLSAKGGVGPAPVPGFTRDEWFELGPCWFRDRDPAAVMYWNERAERAERRLQRARGAGVRPASTEYELAQRALAIFKATPVG
jgi:tRNA (adenine22-N1)-methyltransferase